MLHFADHAPHGGAILVLHGLMEAMQPQSPQCPLLLFPVANTAFDQGDT